MAPQEQKMLLGTDFQHNANYSAIEEGGGAQSLLSSSKHGETTRVSGNWTIPPRYTKLIQLGHFWQKFVAPVLLVGFLALPMIIYKENYVSAFLREYWYAAFMGIVACSIPSGGAPVAGGIVFLPVLTMMGVKAHNAVAFTAATQMFGVGIFAPMGWLRIDPSIIMLESFLKPMFPIALAGLLTGLLFVPLTHESEVLWTFTIFIVILAAYTAKGLIWNHLDVSTNDDDPGPAAESMSDDVPQGREEKDEEEEQKRAKGGDSKDQKDSVPASASSLSLSSLLSSSSKRSSPASRRTSLSKAERRKFTFTSKTFPIYALAAFLGGMLTSYIGIGVEKIMFLLLTSIHDVDVVAAGISSIVLTGWLSFVAFFFHALCAPPEDGPGPHWMVAGKHVDGNVPYEALMSVLPGILLGSIIGPRINAAVGPRNVMILFVCFLLFDISYNVWNLTEDYRDQVHSRL